MFLSNLAVARTRVWRNPLNARYIRMVDIDWLVERNAWPSHQVLRLQLVQAGLAVQAGAVPAAGQRGCTGICLLPGSDNLTQTEKDKTSHFLWVPGFYGLYRVLKAKKTCKLFECNNLLIMILILVFFIWKRCRNKNCPIFCRILLLSYRLPT